MPKSIIKLAVFIFVIVCGYIMARLLAEGSPFTALMVGGFMIGAVSWVDRRTYKRSPCNCDRPE